MPSSSGTSPRPVSSRRYSCSVISFVCFSARSDVHAGNPVIACSWPRSAAGCRERPGHPSWSGRRPSSAGTASWSAASGLPSGVAHAVVMAHPLATKAIAAGRVKNDAVDARTLAHLLRTNLLPESWIAPVEAREARRLVRMRASLVRLSSRLKCQVHALLADYGINPELTDVFGRQCRRIMAELRLPEVSQHRLEVNLRLIDGL